MQSIKVEYIKEIIVIGQGIAGALLAWELVNLGNRVIVYDSPNKQSSSMHAGGMLHAYNHNYQRVDEGYSFFLQHALSSYRLLGEQLGMDLFFEKELITGFEKDARSGQSKYLQSIGNELKEKLTPLFNGVDNAVICKPVYWLNVMALLNGIRQDIIERTNYIEDNFKPDEISFADNHVNYERYSADYIIFCDGIFGAHQSFFSLPFNYNKGEFVTLKIASNLPGYLFENKYRLIKKDNDEYWFGATNSWERNNNDNFISEANGILKKWLKVPFEVTGHFSIERPTTPGQFPYIGLHPNNSMLGIFNGLGSRGLLYAPFYAKQVSKLLVGQQSQIDHYDSKRFRKLLSKN